MRDTERFLTLACIGGSIAAGAAHAMPWLLVPPVCFIGLLIAEDRAVHQRMGSGNWPSLGYARFLFGTNLYRALRITIVSAALYGIASMSGVGSLLNH